MALYSVISMANQNGIKEKLECLTLKEKLKLIDKVEKGEKKKDIAQQFGSPSNTLSIILKNKDKFSEKQSCSESNFKRKRLTACE